MFRAQGICKYLGILIDKNLSWRNQIDFLILKISKTVGMIAKLRYFVPRNILLHINQSLIHPYISYGLTAWGMASKTALNRILILQKRCLRFIFFSESRAHAIPLFLNTSVLPVHFLYYEAVCCLMHDVANQIAPSNILDLFIKTSYVHSYNTRSSTSQIYYQKFSRLKVQNKAFSRLGPRLWNELPARMRSLPVKTFKKELDNLPLSVPEQCNDYLDTDQITYTFALKKSDHMKHCEHAHTLRSIAGI